MGDEAKPTIIIRRKKKRGHAPHGGSWKVAFADFATAMMAFFLLMWLMGATTEKQKGAISEYFNNPSAVQGASTVPSPNSIQGPGGSSTSMIKVGGGMELYRQPTAEPDSKPVTRRWMRREDGKGDANEADRRNEDRRESGELDEATSFGHRRARVARQIQGSDFVGRNCGRSSHSDGRPRAALDVSAR